MISPFRLQTSHSFLPIPRHPLPVTRYPQRLSDSIVHTFSRRAVGQLLLSRDAVLPTRQEQATEDSQFELATWLVIQEAKP